MRRSPMALCRKFTRGPSFDHAKARVNVRGDFDDSVKAQET